MGNNIHLFKVFDTKYVLDVNSGCLHELDDISYDIIQCIDKDIDPISKLEGKYSLNEISEVLNEINELIDSEYLFSKDTHKEDVDGYLESLPIKSLCLNVCMDCNFRCKYCFAEDAIDHTNQKYMSFETGKKAIDFLISKSNGRRNLELDFFGGEPLMNYSVVKKLTLYAKSLEKEKGKIFHLTITTNGLLLDDEKIEFLNNNMDNIVLSLDGRKEINDQMRVTKDGKGTYDYIKSNLYKLIKLREKDNKDYFVRGTITKYNLDFTNDVLFINNNLNASRISLEPVLSEESQDYGITRDMLNDIKAEYRDLLKKLIEKRKSGNEIMFYHFHMDIYKGPCSYKRLVGCSAGREYLSITPDGSIYPCHQFNDMTDFYMGNVEIGIEKPEVGETLSHCHIYSKEECKNCWARFYCSGLCHAGNYKFTGDIKKPYDISCQLQKDRIECALHFSAVKKSGM